VQMMLDHLGEPGSAAKVDAAIEKVLQSEDVTSMSASCGISTSEWGDRVLAALV